MPNQTDVFFYLAAFVTVVLGLAVGDMVTSVHRLIRARERMRWSWLAALSATFVFLSVLTQFFTLWERLGPTRVFFYDLVITMICPTLIAVAALAVLPDDVPEDGLDLDAFYFANRAYLFTVLGLAFVTDFVQIVLALDWATEDGVFEAVVQTVLYALVTGLYYLLLRSSSRRVHLVGLTVLLALAVGGYALWEVAIPPASV